MASEPSSQPPMLRFGVFELHTQTGELRKAGQTVRLRPQAARLLTILATQPGQLLSREQLQDDIWGKETFVDFEHGLNFCIRQIRTALDDDADTPRYIETLPRRGYRFIAPVEAGPKASASQTPSAPASRSRSVWGLAAVFLGLLLIIGIALGVLNRREFREGLFGGSAPPVHTIAVLPLLNLSGDANQDYFADGITEALTTDLARMETVQVISRSSTMQYKGAKKALPAIARELHADAIVEGSVQRFGNRVRVTAQLIRAATDQHLWAETYERDSRDILALQDEVASAIAAQIAGRLGGPQPLPLAKARSISPEAYETYLKANY